MTAVAAPADWLVGKVRPRTYARTVVDAAAPIREGHRYALAAVGHLLSEIAGLQPGARNEGAFSRACRLVELTNAPWSGLDFEQVQSAYLNACERANGDGHFLDGEAWSVWLKAQKRVGANPAILPVADHLGSGILFADLPEPPPSDFGQAGQGPAPDPDVEQVSPFEAAVRRAAWDMAAREEAKRRLDAGRAVVVDFAAELLDDDGLDKIQDLDPLIAGYLDLDSLARINGPSGHGKSFVAIEMAACVATGRMWHGQRVTQGAVVYVAAEGVRGIRKRVAAWCQLQELDRAGVLFLPRAVQIGGPEWPAFVAGMAELKPALIVLDTQARMTADRKENDAQEMGQVVVALDALRVATTACVLLIHHRGLTGEHGRGSTAIKGALQSELDVAKTGMNLSIKVKKQKDDAELPPLLLTMNPVGESVVLIGNGEARGRAAGLTLHDPVSTLSRAEQMALVFVDVLQETAAAGDTKARIEARACERFDFGGTRGSRTGALSRTWDYLTKRGRIAKAMGREAFFFIECDGLGPLEQNPDKKVGDGPEWHVSDFE